MTAAEMGRTFYDIGEIKIDGLEPTPEMKELLEKREILLDYLDQIEYTIIETDEGTVELAEKFIDFGFLKRKSYDDCRHIAAAILAGCDFIISWNFKHIVNVKTIWGIKAITTYEGYKDLMIYPLSALLEEEAEDYGSDDKRT